MEVNNQEDPNSAAMEQDFFALLPPEITNTILSRLPVRTIALCKCVRKAWKNLLETDHFVNSYHSKSCAALALPMPATVKSNWFIVFELKDDLDSYDPITEFNFPGKARFLQGSSDDLILLRNLDANDLYVCNPITREFIKLHSRRSFYDRYDVSYGFGLSKKSRKHKVVRLETESDFCDVYTLGIGRWRRMDAPTESIYSLYGSASANGELYWLALGERYKTWICCFDIETERFSSFSCPPRRGSLLTFRLVSLRDSLFAIDDSTDEDIMIWSWKGSWTLEYVLEQHPDYVLGFNFLPLHVFKNGDVLMLYAAGDRFLCYSIDTKAYQEIPPLGASAIIYSNLPLVFTPSFRSLRKNFGRENVMTF